MADRKSVPFHGVVAIGNSRDEAINNYKMAASGKGVSGYVDKARSLSFVTTANTMSELFNPNSGDLDLEKSNDLLKGLDFESNSHTEGREVNYYVCASGCGAHVVYDSDNLVKYCPICTASVDEGNEDSDDEGTDVEGDDDTDDTDDAGDNSADGAGDEGTDSDDMTSESDDADGDGEDAGSDEGEGEDTGSDEGDGEDDEIPSESDDGDGDSDADDETGGEDGDTDVDDDAEDGKADVNEPVVVASTSKEGAIAAYQRERIGVIHASAVQVNYLVCASGEGCGAHVISEADINSCPICASDLSDPEGEGEGDEEGTDLEVMDDEGDDEGTGDAGDDSSDDGASEEGSKDAASESGDAPAISPELSGSPTEVDALDNLDDSGEEAHAHLDISFSSSINGQPVWTAFYKGVPVATASMSDSKHQDIFTDPAFGNAVMASSKHAGVVNTLREMGFKAIAYTVNIDRHVEQRVEAALASERAEMATFLNRYKESMTAALATASVGITRGFFTGLQNPLKDALYSALSTAGVKNPDVLLHNAFKSSADSYHSILFAKAAEIMDKPEEVRESLAKAVLEMNIPAVASAAPALEDRLSSLGTEVSTSRIQEQPGEVSHSSGDGGFGAKAATVCAHLGRRRF